MKNIVRLLCGCYLLTLSTASANQFSSDVPLIQPEQMSRQFWQTKLTGGDKVLLTPEQIASRNKQTFAVQSEMQSLDSLPPALSKAELDNIIAKVSQIPSSARFYADGSEVSQPHWQQYQALLAIDKVQAQNPLQFGLVVKRTALRAFPTEDRVFNSEANLDLDRFAETALFPTDAVAILHYSVDNSWALVQSFNYTGWVKTNDIATGSKEQVLGYARRQPFLVATGATVHTAYTPTRPDISELQLEMGVRLALMDVADSGFNVHGQNPLASYIVSLPVRSADGSLAFVPALIPRSADVSLGYLPFTANNILRQAFKFLGERYGWGHDYNGRDCTGFISEIFRSFGFVMPRNSGQQGKGAYGDNIRFDQSSSTQDKLSAIQQARVGDLFYFPGHVSLYLGMLDNQPFMIHDVNTLIYPLENGQLYRGTLNGVVVTPMLPLNANTEQSYLDALYAIKSMR